MQTHTPQEDEAYYLEQVTLDEDDEDFDYKEVVVEDHDNDDVFSGADDEDEDLEQALLSMRTREDGAAVALELPPRPDVTRRPEVLDDFIRNVLLKMGMVDTLDMFQREWYRLQGEGRLSTMDTETVPDIYLRNQKLADQLKTMQLEIDQMREVSRKAKSTWDKFRKERDFHKMHHKRVVQEKNKLVTDLKRLKQHYSNYEPMLKMMRAKYETAMKEKMLVKLERDRLASRLGALEAQLRQLEAARPMDQTAMKSGGDFAAASALSKKPRAAKLPDENRPNPYLEQAIDPPTPQAC